VVGLHVVLRALAVADEVLLERADFVSDPVDVRLVVVAMTVYYNENDPKAAAWLRGSANETGGVKHGD
jgi:hypothetical protein